MPPNNLTFILTFPSSVLCDGVLIAIYMLQTWSSTILVVSHDREFLNNVATDIIHIHSKRLDAYRGNYEVFVKTKNEHLKNQQKEYEAQKQYRDHIQVCWKTLPEMTKGR